MTNISTTEKQKLNLESAQIAWHELQRFFANGTAIFVASELDLIDVAWQFSADNSNKVEQWMQQTKVAKVSDLQAKQWHKDNVQVWAIVVKPWILVQEEKPLK